MIKLYVVVLFNSDAEGKRIDADQLEEKDIPQCWYGPFDTDKEANYWMEEVYPDGDTDVYDMFSRRFDAGDNYVNPPDIFDHQPYSKTN